MLWEYERKEANDKRLDALLIEKGNDGWELAYAHRGKQTRVNTDPDWWELIFKRPKAEPGAVDHHTPAVAVQPVPRQ